MVLPLILGLAGSALGSAGMLGGLGALGAGAIGSGLGSYLETGDLEKGILTGLGSFAGGALAGKLLGSTAAAGADKIAGGTAAAANPMATGAASLPLKADYLTMGSGANAMNTVAQPSMFQTAKAIAATPQFMGSQFGGMIGGSLGGMGGSKEEKSDIDASEKFPIPRTMATPPTGYRPGFDPEFNYGISTPQSATDIRNYSKTRRFVGGGAVNALGPIRLAAGGIASLDGMDQQALNAPEGGNEKDIVVEAIRAIKGQVEDPRPALGRFLAMYGEDALRDLVNKVEEGKAEGEVSKDGGRVQGPGDGMDDRVPAQIKETGEDVLLADSEYVVPADVVSHLGNGSSDAGAKALDAMLDRVRAARTGKTEQAPAIEPKQALPA